MQQLIEAALLVGPLLKGFVQFLQAALPSLLGWPVAIVVVVLVLRREINALLQRVNLVKAGGVEFSATATAQALDAAKPSGDFNDLTQPAIKGYVDTMSAAGALPEKPQRAEINERWTYFANHATVAHAEKMITEKLEQMGLSLASEETSRLLIRNLAAEVFLKNSLRTYHLIFGSQMLALAALADGNIYKPLDVYKYYQAAVEAEPEFYKTYSFDNWLDFLVTQDAVMRNADGTINVTLFGQDFMRWTIENGVRQPAH